MKFDDFLKKHGYPSIYPLHKNEVNNPLTVRGQFDVGMDVAPNPMDAVPASAAGELEVL